MGNVSLKTLWGLARSQELHMSDEELHLLVQSHTGKGSLRELTKKDLSRMVGVLAAMKASANGTKDPAAKTSLQRQKEKVYRLAQELGWYKPARVNGMCQRMFGVACVEWLDSAQCSKLIEALKKMLQRQRDKERSEDGGKEEADGSPKEV